jgi:hypothetical protein
VDLLQLVDRAQPPRDHRLVGHHDGQVLGLVDQAQPTVGGVGDIQLVRRGQQADVPVQSAVPAEEDRFLRPGQPAALDEAAFDVALGAGQPVRRAHVPDVLGRAVPVHLAVLDRRPHQVALDVVGAAGDQRGEQGAVEHQHAGVHLVGVPAFALGVLRQDPADPAVGIGVDQVAVVRVVVRVHRERAGDDAFLPGGAGDRAGRGVVPAGLGAGARPAAAVAGGGAGHAVKSHVLAGRSAPVLVSGFVRRGRCRARRGLL